MEKILLQPEEQNQMGSENDHFKDMNRIDGMPTEVEWKIFTGNRNVGLLEKIHSLTIDLNCEPEHFKDRIIFMSMYNDIACGEKEKQKDVNTIARECELCSKNSIAVIGLPWCPDQKRNGTELTLANATDPGTTLQRTWWRTSQIPVT